MDLVSLLKSDQIFDLQARLGSGALLIAQITRGSPFGRLASALICCLPSKIESLLPSLFASGSPAVERYNLLLVCVVM